MDILIRQMMEKQGGTEELKARDQMAWVRVVNGIRNMGRRDCIKRISAYLKRGKLLREFLADYKESI